MHRDYVLEISCECQIHLYWDYFPVKKKCVRFYEIFILLAEHSQEEKKINNIHIDDIRISFIKYKIQLNCEIICNENSILRRTLYISSFIDRSIFIGFVVFSLHKTYELLKDVIPTPQKFFRAPRENSWLWPCKELMSKWLSNINKYCSKFGYNE